MQREVQLIATIDGVDMKWQRQYSSRRPSHFSVYTATMIVVLMHTMNQAEHSLSTNRFDVYAKDISRAELQVAQGTANGAPRRATSNLYAENAVQRAELVSEGRPKTSILQLSRDYFVGRCVAVQIFRGGHIVQVYFPRPAVCKRLSEDMKDRFHETMDYTADENQIIHKFFDSMSWLMDEMHYKQKLSEFAAVFRLATQRQYEIIPWMIALLINFCMLLTVRRESTTSGGTRVVYEPASFETFIAALGVLLLISNLVIFGANLLLHVPLAYSKVHRHHELEVELEARFGSVRPREMLQNLLTAFWAPMAFVIAQQLIVRVVIEAGYAADSATLTYFVEFSAVLLAIPFFAAVRQTCHQRPAVLWSLPRTYCVVHDTVSSDKIFPKLIFSGLAFAALAAQQPLLFAPQVLSVLNFSETLRNVIKAIRGPVVQLLLTAMFGVLVIYVFMVAAFFFFFSDLANTSGYYLDADDQESPCTSMLSCFPVFLVNGLMTGGGIGEFIADQLGNTPAIYPNDDAVGRYLFDLLFFVTVTILLLNLIFGIIIDTFSFLRDQTKEQRTLRGSKCIICGLPRHDFEEANIGGWEHHYKREHNLWNYFFFAVHLQTKAPSEFDGIEDYVAKCLRNKDISWIPRRRALSLELRNAAATPESTVGGGGE